MRPCKAKKDEKPFDAVPGFSSITLFLTLFLLKLLAGCGVKSKWDDVTHQGGVGGRRWEKRG